MTSAKEGDLWRRSSGMYALMARSVALLSRVENEKWPFYLVKMAKRAIFLPGSTSAAT